MFLYLISICKCWRANFQLTLRCLYCFPSTTISLGLFACLRIHFFLVKRLFWLPGFWNVQRLFLSTEATLKGKPINVMAWDVSAGNNQLRSTTERVFLHVSILFIKDGVESVNGKTWSLFQPTLFLTRTGKKLIFLVCCWLFVCVFCFLFFPAFHTYS